MRTYIQQPGQVGVQGGTIGNAGYLAQQLPPMARLDGQMTMNTGQMNDAFLQEQEQERQRLLQEQEAQSELNASMFRGGQYGQADQYSAASSGFQNKFVS
jgi:hypothetical protein